MRQSITGYAGGSTWSCCTRTRHYSNVAFRYAKFVIALFDNIPVGSGPIADKDFANDMYFQVGVEYPFTPGYTDIPARIPVLFRGSNVLGYSTKSGPFGFAVSEVVDFGATVPAGTFFGLWTTNENANGYKSAANTLPYQLKGAENYQPKVNTNYRRFQGSISQASSLIRTNTAVMATAVTPYSSLQYGNNESVFTPCMMLIETAATTPHYYGIGDSICLGYGEGGNGSATYGDSFGSAFANAGYLARWAYEYAKSNFVNLGRSSDKYAYFSNTNWQYRLPLLAQANPTHVIMQNVHNDIGSGSGAADIFSLANPCYAAVINAVPDAAIITACCTPDSTGISSPVWKASTGFTAGTSIYGPYICRKSGTSASSGRGPTGTGTGIVDGTVTWDFILAGSPNAQVASTGWGNAASHRGMWNDEYVRSATTQLPQDGWLDPNPSLEYGYVEGEASTETGIWASPDGVAYDLTLEGHHPNSRGASLIASTLKIRMTG